MKLDIISLLFPPKVMKLLTLLVDLFTFGLFTYLAYESMEIVITMNQKWSSLPISMNWVYVVVPISFILTALRSLQMFFIDWNSTVKKLDFSATGDEYVSPQVENISDNVNKEGSSE